MVRERERRGDQIRFILQHDCSEQVKWYIGVKKSSSSGVVIAKASDGSMVASRD